MTVPDSQTRWHRLGDRPLVPGTRPGQIVDDLVQKPPIGNLPAPPFYPVEAKPGHIERGVWGSWLTVFGLYPVSESPICRLVKRR